jgi:putative DNA primase/helicase
MGATTEAGIRQAVGNDALPVIFDESEGQKGMEERRQAVIQLMRQASSEGRGRIMKGTAGHSAVAFTMRSSFLMSSIGVGLKEAADLTRTVVLTIKPLEAYSFGERKMLEEQWQRFLSLAHGMRKDTPQRLLSRQMRNIFTLKSNIEIFKEVIASTLGNRRLGDQLGTLLAGSYSLISTRKVTRPLAEKYLDNYDWSEFTNVKAAREDMALLQHICGKLIRAETRNGTQDRAIGELIYGIIYPHTDDTLNPTLADQTLSRYGLRMEPDKSGIWVATGIPALDQLMRSSDYSEGWQKVLARLPNCKRSDGPMRFRGQNSRAIFVPMDEWPLGNENV